MRVVATLPALLMLSMSAAAGAEGPTVAAPVGRALSPAGRAIVHAGLVRMRPTLLARMLADARAEPEAKAALAKALARTPALAGYGDGYVFVGEDGLAPAGESLVAFVAKARLHAVDVVVPEIVEALPSHRDAPLPEVSDDALAAAWTAASGEGQARLDAAARLLADELHEPAQGTALAPELRAGAEVALGEILATLVAALPAHPRSEAVLIDAEHGYYLSPDVVWRGKPAEPASPEALAAALAAAREGRLEAHLRGLVPRHPQYAALVAAAERYAGICAAGEWAPLPVPKTPKDAQSPEAVKALQARLAREGFWTGAPTGVWDQATEASVLEVRRLRQLSTKAALLDQDLARALDVPCAERLRTILLNVRRWRYSAWNGERESVQVNLAGQLLRYFRDDQLVMSQRTVVGSDKSYFSKLLGRRYWRNATPILHDTIATVIVNPEWNVPTRIARDELSVEIEKDPDYLDKHGFKVRTGGDGATYYTQAAGPGNALGRIKILFPNSESVYLHDTPGRAAFNLPVRALSHGCVRVQNAVDFGAELVRADKAKSGEVVDVKYIKDLATFTTRTHVFELAHEIPVFLEYYTASVDEAGALWFHPDIYGYDAESLAPVVAAP